MEELDLCCDLGRARAETDRLFTHLDCAALYDRPIAERHRIVFYLGHLEVFDWNLMKQTGMDDKSPVPAFDNLFAFGIDPEPGKLPDDQPADWPALPQIQSYNREVRAAIDRYVERKPDPDSVQMMVEHRHMHAETFAYILHNLDARKKRGPADISLETARPQPEMIQIPAGSATLGKLPDTGFGWDNEFMELSVNVPSFSVSRYKITNGQFLDFMMKTGAPAPYYWYQENGPWFYRGMFQDQPLPLHWPVYVTWQQATAYARFHNLSLPTEPQYHRFAFGAPEGTERPLPWKSSSPVDGNFDYCRWDPMPVNASPATDSAFGAAQTVGNGWEWTSTLFAPFPGFASRPAYPGYSSNFFDNAHYVLKGASPRTSASLVRRSLRNWFRPDYPYVYATFRVVED
ncbi:MAG: SUMF1/EgtB/PvdO family nonheme iron enzyme [Acidobacteriota bacterium]|nr:SUMF1/EgtB/PvdO family nonheme iron enzyme [Acidobacteriota bacterium]